MWQTHDQSDVNSSWNIDFLSPLCSSTGDIWVWAWMSWCHGATSHFWKVFVVFLFPKPSLCVPLVHLSLPLHGLTIWSPPLTVIKGLCWWIPIPSSESLRQHSGFMCVSVLCRGEIKPLQGRLCSQPFPLNTEQLCLQVGHRVQWMKWAGISDIITLFESDEPNQGRIITRWVLRCYTVVVGCHIVFNFTPLYYEITKFDRSVEEGGIMEK